MESANSEINSHQNVIVMRHSDRIDLLDPLWASTAKKPLDPPLAQEGMARAFQTGQRIRSQLGFPIHRVFISPFLRCIQTAYEVVAALSAVHVDPNAISSQDVSSIDNTKVKVAIEFGLARFNLLNTKGIESESAPKHRDFEFNVKNLEAMFPEETVDFDVDMVYKELPQWGESLQDYRDRYVNTLKSLVDKYPSENLLLITHAGAVSTTRNNFINSTKYKVDYCGYVELRRKIMTNDDEFGKSEEFEVVTSHGISFKHHTVPIHHPVLGQSTV